MEYSAKQLYELQELDWKIAAGEESLAQVRERLADDSAIVAVKATINHVETDLADRQKRRAPIETALGETEESLKSIESKVYAGGVISERQFAAFEEERSFLQRGRGEDEDRLLELMVEIEELQPSLVTAKSELVSLNRQRNAERKGLLVDQERLIRELADLAIERAGVVAEVPKETLAWYESLRGVRGGHAVAKVERGICQGCRITLPTMEQQRARDSRRPVQCSSCQRILYVD